MRKRTSFLFFSSPAWCCLSSVSKHKPCSHFLFLGITGGLRSSFQAWHDQEVAAASVESWNPSLGTWNLISRTGPHLAPRQELSQWCLVPMASSTFCFLFFWPLPPVPTCLDSFNSVRPCGCPRALRIWGGKSTENNSAPYPCLSPGALPRGLPEVQSGKSFWLETLLSLDREEKSLAFLLAFLVGSQRISLKKGKKESQYNLLSYLCWILMGKREQWCRKYSIVANPTTLYIWLGKQAHCFHPYSLPIKFASLILFA